MFFNVLNYHISLNNFESKDLKVFALCIQMTHTKLITQLLGNLYYELVHVMSCHKIAKVFVPPPLRSAKPSFRRAVLKECHLSSIVTLNLLPKSHSVLCLSKFNLISHCL